MSLRLVPSTAQSSRRELSCDQPALAAELPRFDDEFPKIAIDYLETIAEASATPIGIERIDCVDIYPADAIVTTRNGARYVVIAHGALVNSGNAGLRDVGSTERLLARCYGLHHEDAHPILVVTSHLPDVGSQSARLLAQAGHHLGIRLRDVVALSGDLAGARRLQQLFADDGTGPTPVPWRNLHLASRVDLFAPVRQAQIDFPGLPGTRKVGS